MEYNAICPKCEKMICVDILKKREKCPLCGKTVSTEEAVGLFAGTVSTKDGDMAVPEVGGTVSFGTYMQKGYNASPIEWLVLDKKDGRALLLSKYALALRGFHSGNSTVRWKTCYLRKWLNSEFIEYAFSPMEKVKLCTVTVAAEKNPKYGTYPGNDSEDRVFLLSIGDVKKYFGSDRERICLPTECLVGNRSGYMYNPEESCIWWLRSPGKLSYYAATVRADGSVSEERLDVDTSCFAVRPALWIEY